MLAPQCKLHHQGWELVILGILQGTRHPGSCYGRIPNGLISTPADPRPTVHTVPSDRALVSVAPLLASTSPAHCRRLPLGASGVPGPTLKPCHSVVHGFDPEKNQQGVEVPDQTSRNVGTVVL